MIYWIKIYYHSYQTFEKNLSVSVKYQKNLTDRDKERKCLAIQWEWGGGSKTRGKQGDREKTQEEQSESERGMERKKERTSSRECVLS